MKFDKEKAQYAVDFIENLKLTGDFHGQPFVFQDWNRKIITDVFGTLNNRGLRQYKDIYVEVPKKNTKSSLGCGICAKQLFDKKEPNGLIHFAGADKINARETLYEPLVEMIEQDPALISRVKITDSLKEITNKETNTRLKVLSSDVSNKHGPNASLTVMDEIHTWHGRELYDVLTHGTGLARHEPLRIVLTTAGRDPDRVTIGWELHEKAMAVIEARKKGGDKSKDIATMYAVIFAYLGEDIWNEKNWYKANPMLDIVFPIEALRELALEAKLSRADEVLFRWLNLNQWITIRLTTWQPLDLFDSTVGDWSRNDLLGKDCYIGGDFSTTTDLSGTCLLFPPQAGVPDWRMIWDCWIPEENMKQRIKVDKVPYDKWAAMGWISPTPGNVIDHLKIAERYGEYKKMYKIHETREGVMDGLPVDISLTVTLSQVIKKDYDLDLIDIPQTYTSLTDPMNFYENLLKTKRLTHEDNPVARWCFGNTSIVKNGNSQIKYVKEHKGKSVDRTKRIDLTVASIMACARGRFYELEKANEKLPAGWGM